MYVIEKFLEFFTELNTAKKYNGQRIPSNSTGWDLLRPCHLITSSRVPLDTMVDAIRGPRRIFLGILSFPGYFNYAVSLWSCLVLKKFPTVLITSNFWTHT